MHRRFLVPLALAALGGASAFAGAPEKDRRWDALITQAQAHGGVETVLDKSASYVFQVQDGSFVTLTRVLKGSRRAVCLIAKAQNRSVCVDWDTGETAFGERADAASPWKIGGAPPLEEAWANEPGPFQTLMSGFLDVVGSAGAVPGRGFAPTGTDPLSGYRGAGSGRGAGAP